MPNPETEVQIPPTIPEVSLPEPERRSAPPALTETAVSTRDPAEWRDCRTGVETRVLRPDQNFADLYRGAEPLSLGRAIRALIVGTGRAHRQSSGRENG